MTLNQAQRDAWLGLAAEVEHAAPETLPRQVDCCYTPPNPDGSKKACANCVMYATGDRSCYIHDPNLPIDEMDVCNYHVFGQPMVSFEKRLPMLPLQPEQSGLISTEDGTSCSSCVHYDTVHSRCFALANEFHNDYAEVEPLGCCTLWEQRAPELEEES